MYQISQKSDLHFQPKKKKKKAICNTEDTSYTLIQQTGQQQKVVVLKDINSYTEGTL